MKKLLVQTLLQWKKKLLVQTLLQWKKFKFIVQKIEKNQTTKKCRRKYIFFGSSHS